MKELIATAALLLIAPAWASAQDAGHQYRGEGYLFIGEGTYPENSETYGVSYVGGGGEVRLFKGLGVESELGVMGRPGVWGEGLFSVDPSYQFLRASSKSKLVPFVEAGYTRTFANNVNFPLGNLFNFAGGIHYWAFKRLGLRLEFRDYVQHTPWVTTHYPALRIALALR
jgi:hypothetical protein